MIVEIYQEEKLTAPFIGVDVQMRTTKDKENFTSCLTKKISDHINDNRSENSVDPSAPADDVEDVEERHSSLVIASTSRTFHKGLNLSGVFDEILSSLSNFSLSQLFFPNSVHNNKFDTFIVALALTNK